MGGEGDLSYPGGIFVSFLNGGCERGDGTGLVVRDVLYSGIVLYVVVRPGVIRSDTIIGALGCEMLAGKNDLL